MDSPAPVLARRESYFRPSPVRAVFETAMRPDVVSLAGGNPDLSFLPHSLIADLTADLLAQRGEDILQYGSGAGTDAARELSAELMRWAGAPRSVPEIQMTSGSQAGLDAVTKLLCDPGDVIIAEGPTYVGVLGTFGAYEADVRQVSLDEDGLDPQAVAEAIDQAQAEGRKVAFVYTITAYQNPSGRCLNPARYEDLIEVCARRGVLLVEDDAYGLLGFGTVPETRRPALASVSAEQVIHLGSYSKIFSPGARVGWISAPVPLRERLQVACESVCITPSVLAQELVTAYVGTPAWREGLAAQLAAYEDRCQAAVAAVHTHLPAEVTYHVPAGGFFLWLSLPESVAAPGVDVLELGLREKVVVIPGSGCYVGLEPGTHARLAFSAVGAETIDDGVARLARALNS